jgi:hypothetical protein
MKAEYALNAGLHPSSFILPPSNVARATLGNWLPELP